MDSNMSSTGLASGQRKSFTPPSPKSFHWLLMAVIAAITLSVFSVVRSADFLPWDDDINLYNNPHIKAGITAESLKWMFTDSSYVHRYMPLGWLAFAVDVNLAGEMNPTTYHVGNLLLHVVNALLLFTFITWLLRKAKPATSPLALSVAAAIGALFWAIHPLRAEPVAWSSARIYHVALLFVLTSFLAYARYTEHPSRKYLYALSVVLFFLASLTYPIVVGIPVAIVAMDLFPLRRLTLSPRALVSSGARRVWAEKIPFFLVSAIALGATIWNRAHATKFVPAASLEEFGLLERLAQGFYVWAAYLWKTCWPMDLCATYTELLEFRWWEPRFLLSFALVAGVTVLLFRKRERWPAALVMWFTYLALLFPMLGLSEHPHYIYDRYSFIVSVLFSIAVGWLVLQLWQDTRRRSMLLGISVATLALCGFLSSMQAGVWNNPHTFLPYVISQLGEHPARAKRQVVHGSILRTEKRLEEAEAAFRGAIAVRPDYTEAHVNLGEVLSEQGRNSDAVVALQRALEQDPSNVRARQSLGVALGSMKRYDAAVAEFKEVIRLDDRNANAMHNLAVTLHQMGQKELASDYYRQAEAIRQSGNASEH